jgi:integrase
VPGHQVQQDARRHALRRAGGARPSDARCPGARRHVPGKRAVPARGVSDRQPTRRNATRDAPVDHGSRQGDGRRQAEEGSAEKFKLIEWSIELRAVIDKALTLQRTTSLYVSGNSDGQQYTISGFNTNLRRLMTHTATKAEKDGISFTRFTLKDMRPAAVTHRVGAGNETITNATGHSSDRMVKQVYDKRRTKSARATE